jgi:hypothetical protein
MSEQVYLSKLTRRYRIALEESWFHEKAEARKQDCRWFEIIPCKGFKKQPMQEGPFIALNSEDPPILMLYTNRIQNAKKSGTLSRNVLEPGQTSWRERLTCSFRRNS